MIVSNRIPIMESKVCLHYMSHYNRCIFLRTQPSKCESVVMGKVDIFSCSACDLAGNKTHRQ